MFRSNETHEHLLADMREGSVYAFDRFYEQYADFVLRLALKLTGKRMDAEDICQDVLLEAFRKADQYDPARGSIESWLAIRTKCRCLDLLRRRQRRKAVEVPEDLADPRDPAEEAVRELDREQVRAALRKLPVPQRRVLYGMYYAGRTQRELAAELMRPLGTIKSSVRYGLHNIRKQLLQLGWTERQGEGKPW